MNLIEALNWYLLAMFLMATMLRMRTYWAVFGLIRSFSSRWPKLLAVLKSHRGVFFCWPMLLPLLCALLLFAANFIASHGIWDDARLTWSDLSANAVVLLPVVVSGLLMLVVDSYYGLAMTRVDRAEIEKNLDRAEKWLKGWKAPTIRVLSFGLVNPKKIVGKEVKKALTDASHAMNGKLWRWSLQIGLQFAFGLLLWISWGFAG